MAPSECGLLYVATGDRFQREAVQSAKTFAEQMPHIPIHLATRGDFTADVFQSVIRLADGVNRIGDKITALLNPPFEKTIFVDTDTICISPINCLFDALEHWNLLAAHAPIREHLIRPDGVPDYFPECNTGLLGIRSSEKTSSFIQLWKQEHDGLCSQFGTQVADQPAFRSALWKTKLDHLTLTPEFNLRTCMKCFVGGNAKVHVIHDRTPRAAKALKILTNKPIAPSPRVF